MEGVRVFSPDDWEASGMDATLYAAGDLKTCLEGLARHLFGKSLMSTFWTIACNRFHNHSSYSVIPNLIYIGDSWRKVKKIDWENHVSVILGWAEKI